MSSSVIDPAEDQCSVVAAKTERVRHGVPNRCTDVFSEYRKPKFRVRFLAIEGERRAEFGQVLEHALLGRDPGADEAAKTKATRAPFRAPLVLVAIARFREHPKVPEMEQRLSVGCAAHAALLAAEALGYAGVWRTGAAARDPAVMADLGLTQNEEIVGFIYLGTRDGVGKAVPDLDPDEFLSHW